ncbi:MAG: hypothetical protein HEQ29_02950 [Dolichospermum sp. LBC05a]|nr:hypothetical protein [Dolichospermum sp. OL01]MCO5795791.1 hypothetical protein [Dolichospermum sp. OL03]MCS6281864.1 hypothetical protein [Dolichospermum sp.]QSV57460.1 MAG: hypothetical protein HEQ29_02950 [Dolichospermum sp. LBC05a]
MPYKPAFNWMILAFLVRLVAFLAIHLYSLEAGFKGFYPLASGGDDTTYWTLANDIFNGYISLSTPSSYPFILAALFSITGQNLLYGKFLSVLADSFTVYIGVYVARELSNSNKLTQFYRNYSAHLTGLLLTFYPSAIWHSTQLLRDSLIVLFGLLNLYLSILILKKGKKKLWIYWSITLLLVYSLRPYAAVSLIMSLFAYLMLIWNAKIKRKLSIMLLLLIPCALIPYVLGQGLFGLERILPMLSVDEISSLRKDAYSIGGSSTGISINYSNPITFMITYFPSYITAILGPFPWQVNAPVQLMALPEAIVMWILCFILWKNRHTKVITSEGKEENLLLVFSLILIGILSLFSDNIGANTRLRLLPWVSFFIYISIQLAKKRMLRRKLTYDVDS